MNPRWRSKQEGLDLWLLLDQSASAGTLLAKNVSEWTKLLEQSRRSANDQLHMVDYAADVMRRGGQETLVYSGGRELKRTALAIENTLVQTDRDRPSRIVVFTDGFSTEPLPPGLGGKLLEDIAKRGNGRIFFSTDAGDLPSLFSMETVAVARSAFVKEATGGLPTGQWYEISENAFDWLPDVDGYNLSYVRDWASQALVTTDTYKAPLVAYGQRGIERVATVSFPLGGEYSERARSWSKMGDFVQTLGRWLMGESFLAAGIDLVVGLRIQKVVHPHRIADRESAITVWIDVGS
jgi:hypothetical protein